MKELVLQEKESNEMVEYLPEHKEMISIINNNLPEIHRATSLFCKTQSQFMDNMLTVSHPTPIRNIRQILAEVTKSREALRENFYKNKKKQVEVKILYRSLEDEDDELRKELIQAEIEEKLNQMETSKLYVSGAIRKLSNYIEQYNSILKGFGVESFNEIDFEKEEERYHIMKAFDQALTSARSKNGVIDEGNHIYLNQIGINGAVAQKEIYNHLAYEGKLLSEGKEPTHELILSFLNKMADKFKGCSQRYAVHKGMSGKITEFAALKQGDTKLIK